VRYQRDHEKLTTTAVLNPTPDLVYWDTFPRRALSFPPSRHSSPRRSPSLLVTHIVHEQSQNRPGRLATCT
jgi:hypothetical protein